MARPDLFSHLKFRRLSKVIGSVPLAVGSLELLWHAGYSTGSDEVGQADDVEYLCQWTGEPGRLSRALHETGFLDQNGDGNFRIHHLYDNAPEYVRKRIQRQRKRESVGQTADTVRQTADTSQQTATVPDQTRPTQTRPKINPLGKEHREGGDEGRRPPPPEALAEVWNEFVPPLHPLKGLSPARKQHARARLAEHPELDYWREVLRGVTSSAFCLGANDRGWKANFDWLLRPDTAAKVLEGRYKGGPIPRHTAVNINTMAQLEAEWAKEDGRDTR